MSESNRPQFQMIRRLFERFEVGGKTFHVFETRESV